MRIAIVGSGISGLMAAHVLSPVHDVTLLEAEERLGGHTNTVDVSVQGTPIPVDTGFIVFNERTYPDFSRLLDQLGVPSRPGTMSFSVHCEKTGLEYNGGSWAGLFAQKRNLLRPGFLGMMRDITRFHQDAGNYLRGGDETATMKEFVTSRPYGSWFRDRYLFPIAAAIWSADPLSVGAFPAHTMLRFFQNHGMLSVQDRPQWRTVVGGSRTYVQRLRERFRGVVRTGARVTAVQRRQDGVDVTTIRGDTSRFDHVVIAAHSDQALAMLADPTDLERKVLGAVRYRRNDTLLHTDTSVLPRRKRAWAGWNYRLPTTPGKDVTVTYDMNVLQGHTVPQSLLVTLNQTDRIDPEKALERFDYEHPQFDHAAIQAQKRWHEISGVHRVHYCGAWWHYGFHEDGVQSALRVTEALGVPWRP